MRRMWGYMFLTSAVTAWPRRFCPSASLNCKLVCIGPIDQCKILLVEDNEMNRDMLSRRLLRKGYEVVVAVDGRQGVELRKTAISI